MTTAAEHYEADQGCDVKFVDLRFEPKGPDFITSPWTYGRSREDMFADGVMFDGVSPAGRRSTSPTWC